MADSIKAAILSAELCSPDLVMVELHLGDEDALEVLQQLTASLGNSSGGPGLVSHAGLSVALNRWVKGAYSGLQSIDADLDLAGF